MAHAHGRTFVRFISIVSAYGPVKHERFYFEDGNVVFLVETTLFKVHRYSLETKSGVFETMFSLKPPKDQSVEGDSKYNPIHLQGTTVVDFERFLTVLYPRDLRRSDLNSFDEWLSVLELATKYAVDDMREVAIQHATRAGSLAQRIYMARLYHLPDLLLKARIEMCQRQQAITVEEGRMLGVDEVVVLSECRAYIRSAEGRVVKYLPRDVQYLEAQYRQLGDPID
ncbi:uncharacterized protein LAESUDRAFT_319461 [Laetiporus sulphureus 93-53]|uniref:BTB domain-containing protein n=1 Tax=Laetiporus sulphureus 93-53 TaxID=1314785 RepID=A0A165D1B3_9APHY|nr:uncharacterized protein LAESUDRAFT_319461 [Laetiporus sulphureus 93-53]KZT03943.1 hypothetical protein LAESUDRAFT_319461 [Laetiporus sulphureus 93-53]